VEFDVGRLLRPGDNVVAVQVPPPFTLLVGGCLLREPAAGRVTVDDSAAADA